MRNLANLVLTSVVTTAVVTVLVGQQLNVKWLGGTGRIILCPAEEIDRNDVSINRGEIMATKKSEFSRYQLCDGTVLYLDANTQIRLSAYPDPVASQNTKLELIQGRMIVDGLADVRTRNTTVSVTGAGCEIVHYSWLDKADITPLVEAGCQIENFSGQLVAREISRLNTFDTTLETTSPFNPTSSSAASFYNWTGLKFEPLP